MNRTWKVAGVLLLLSILLTVLSATIQVPVPRTRLDPTAQVADSDFVVVRGLPLYFIIDPRANLIHWPSEGRLLANFFLDVGLIFGWLIAIWAFAEVMGIISGFFASPGKALLRMIDRSMNSRTPLSVPFIVIALVALLLGGSGIFLFQNASTRIRSIHTEFVLRQIRDLLDDMETDRVPRSEPALIQVLRAATIDWNSCSLAGNGILDGWGNPVKPTFDPLTLVWTFQAQGKDRRFGTSDDFSATTRDRSTPEQSTPETSIEFP